MDKKRGLQNSLTMLVSFAAIVTAMLRARKVKDLVGDLNSHVDNGECKRYILALRYSQLVSDEYAIILYNALAMLRRLGHERVEETQVRYSSNSSSSLIL